MAIMEKDDFISTFSGVAAREHFAALMGEADRYYFPEFLRLSVENGDLETDGLSTDAYIERRLRTLREGPTTIERRTKGRWFETRSRPLPDGSVFFVSLDISDRRIAQEQLRAAHRLEGVGKLAGGLAHDFNNLLAIVLGNLELVIEETRDEHLKKLVEPCIDATMRGAELTRNMLSFARQAHLEPQEVRLEEIVDRTTGWLRRTLPSSIAVHIETDPKTPPAKADAAATENALLNLVINARDAMPDGGKLTIEVSGFVVDATDTASYSDALEPGTYSMITVSDTGVGIPKDRLDAIFEPFFSTKSPGEGSGLGLSMVQGFMKQSGGAVRVYSEPGHGTTFKLIFPILGPAPEMTTAASAPGMASVTGPARVLVAEDDPDVLSVLVRSLTRAGYTVTSVANGDLAVEAFRSAERFDVLVTDLVMPGTLQGADLAAALREHAPDLPVVFLSGYAREATIHGNGLRPGDIRLMKPFRSIELVNAVEAALNGPAQR
ncbi:MAG: ATP-binding protein [Pseudomonadota bacterium]